MNLSLPSYAGADEGLRHLEDHARSLLVQPAPRESKHGAAGGDQHGVPSTIGLEHRRRAVELEPVDLDDDALRRPDEVDFDAVNADVRLRDRCAAPPHQREKERFGLRPRKRGAPVEGQYVAKPASAAARRMAREETGDVAQRNDVLTYSVRERRSSSPLRQ